MTISTALSARGLAEYLYGRPYRLGSEKLMQDDVEIAFVRDGIEYEREKVLGPGDRVDFLVGTIALELKIKGRAAQIIKQIERYAMHDSIDSVVLLTNVPMPRIPRLHEAKPCYIVSLARTAF